MIPLVDILRIQTSGCSTVATPFMNGAKAMVIGSECLKAIDLGTVSPKTSVK